MSIYPEFMESAGWTLVAGIDPGSRMVGAACIAVRGQELQLVDVRSWKIEGDSIEDRIGFVSTSVENWMPSGVRLTGVENGYVGKGVASGLILAMARGAAVDGVVRGGSQARLVTPVEARAAIGAARWSDRRREAKQRVQAVVARILNILRPLTEDEADACAVCVWAANRVWELERGHA